MAFGLVVYDLLYLSLAALLYAGAGWTAALVFGLLRPGAPLAVGLALAALAGLLALIAQVALLTALTPRLAPGRYPLLRGRVFHGWLLRSMLRRVLLLPSLKWLLFNSNVLRFLALRALGGRIAFTASISSDVDLLDPSLTTVGPGAILGARTGVACHYVENGELVLGSVEIGARALLAAEVGVGPGCTVGERAFIKPRSMLSIGVQVGARAEVGPSAVLDAFCSVGAGAKVGAGAFVAKRRSIADGEVVDRAG